MALVKHRIVSRSVLMHNTINRNKNFAGIDGELMQISMTAYILADGQDVKVYNDTNMGGMVVEYNDGK